MLNVTMIKKLIEWKKGKGKEKNKVWICAAGWVRRAACGSVVRRALAGLGTSDC